METVVTWGNAHSETAAAEVGGALRRATVLSAVILIATIALSAGIYISGIKEIHEPQAKQPGKALSVSFELLRRFDRIALGVGELVIVGGIGALIPLVTAARRRLNAQAAQWTRDSREWQVSLAGLQTQVVELRRNNNSWLATKEQLNERIQFLNADNARLQGELDKRNRSERMLTQRRQELESSKSVLEMHVQARTEELQSLQRRYEMILNSAGEGICGLDMEGRALFVNPTMAQLAGQPASELIGKTEQEIFLWDGTQVEAPLDGQHSGEQIVYRRDGTCFPVEFVKTPIDENGRVIGSVLVFKDITERKRVEETLARKASELARSNAELEQFAFVASHDLQEPLRKIQAFGDRLKARCEGLQSPDVKDYLERMQGAAARMRTLINDLLAFSRVIRSSEPFVQVDLAQVTREVLGDLEVRIEKTGARIDVGDLPTLDADPMQMRQLLLNLITNALKFQMPGATPVIHIQARTLTALSGEALCEISVCDNGIGFDEKYVDKMFAVFQRLHGRGEYEGTGVGLAVCRRIVDRHHGNITAKSTPGQGATFTVTLPIHQPQSEAQG
jgi:PAS domain S-box-containing protein